MQIAKLFDRKKPDADRKARKQLHEFLRLYQIASPQKRLETLHKIERRRAKCQLEAEYKAALLHILEQIDSASEV